MTVTHKWIAGAVALAVAIMAAGWFLLVSPKRSEASDLQSQADAQLQTNQGLETELEVLKQQKKDLPEKQAELAGLRTQIPQTESMPSLIRLLDVAADKAGVDLVSMSPTPAVPVAGLEAAPVDPAAAGAVGVLPSNQLAAINSDITVTGGYFEIERFVNSLENLERYVLVAGMTIGKEEGATADTTQVDDGTLTAVLSSRVFLLPGETVPVEAAAPADAQ
jgi:Tfp pilus assembly protein PilO